MNKYKNTLSILVSSPEEVQTLIDSNTVDTKYFTPAGKVIDTAYGPFFGGAGYPPTLYSYPARLLLISGIVTCWSFAQCHFNSVEEFLNTSIDNL